MRTLLAVKLTLLLTALMILGNASVIGQRLGQKSLSDAEIRQLRTDAYLDANERILTIDPHTLGRNQVFFVTALKNRIDWCLNVYVYARDKTRFKRLWQSGEALTENGCHQPTTCGEPSARAVSEGELQMSFPTLDGTRCTLHQDTYRWNGHTFILNQHQVVPTPNAE